MKRAATLALAALFAWLAPSPMHAESGLDWLKSTSGTKARETGSLPVEGLTPRPIRLRVHPQQAAAVFSELGMQRRIGVIPGGREVTIIAISNQDRYKVRGEAVHAGISGWVKATDLVSPDKNFVATLRQLHARQVMVEDLIAHKQIALGMTPEEVIRSLGRPTQKSFKLTQAGKVENFDYVTYDRVPQYTTQRDAYGNLYNTVHYVKVQTGSMSVGFENGAVSSIEEKEGNPGGNAPVRAVPIPINGFW